MPEVFRFFGFSFFFYSREHEPPHIHVEGNGGMAKFDWDGEEFVQVEKTGIKANDFKKIKKMVDDNLSVGKSILTKTKGRTEHEDHEDLV